MKTYHKILPTVLLALLLFNQTYGGTNYYTTSSGDFLSDACWTPGCPPNPLKPGDSIFVSHNISMDLITYNIKGVMVVESTGILSGNCKIVVKPGGTLINNGEISTTNEMQLNGSFYNNGSCTALTITNTGYICNTGEIGIDPNEIIDNKGTLECGGNLVACNIIASGTSVFRDLTACCNDGTMPTLEYISGTIDSSTVVLCGYLLPVELVNFNVTPMDDHVKIKWKTASETNNDYFTIQRSLDALQWEDLAEVRGKGNSSSIANYTSWDFSPLNGISYYMLRQTDFDGTLSFSEVKAVQMKNELDAIVCNYPEENLLEIKCREAESLQVNIYSSIGQKIFLEPVKEAEKLSYDLSSLSSGIYCVQINNGYINETKKIVIE